MLEPHWEFKAQNRYAGSQHLHLQRLLRRALNSLGVASGNATTKYLSPFRRVLPIEEIVQSWVRHFVLKSLANWLML